MSLNCPHYCWRAQRDTVAWGQGRNACARFGRLSTCHQDRKAFTSAHAVPPRRRMRLPDFPFGAQWLEKGTAMWCHLSNLIAMLSVSRQKDQRLNTLTEKKKYQENMTQFVGAAKQFGTNNQTHTHTHMVCLHFDAFMVHNGNKKQQTWRGNSSCLIMH